MAELADQTALFEAIAAGDLDRVKAPVSNPGYRQIALARLLTIMRTCHMQQLKALAHLTAAIRCHRRSQAVASLLPKRP
jgi:hypothetical protein